MRYAAAADFSLPLAYDGKLYGIKREDFARYRAGVLGVSLEELDRLAERVRSFPTTRYGKARVYQVPAVQVSEALIEAAVWQCGPLEYESGNRLWLVGATPTRSRPGNRLTGPCTSRFARSLEAG